MIQSRTVIRGPDAGLARPGEIVEGSGYSGGVLGGILSWASLLFGASTAIAAWVLLPMEDHPTFARGLLATLASATTLCLIARARLDAVAEEPQPERPSSRTEIEDALGREIFRARRYDRPFSTVLIEPSVVSPQEAAALLERIAQEARQLIRKTDDVGDWDGRRVLLVLAESSAEDAAQLVDRLRHALSISTLRFGVTEYAPDDSTRTILQRLVASLEPAGDDP